MLEWGPSPSHIQKRERRAERRLGEKRSRAVCGRRDIHVIGARRVDEVCGASHSGGRGQSPQPRRLQVDRGRPRNRRTVPPSVACCARSHRRQQRRRRPHGARRRAKSGCFGGHSVAPRSKSGPKVRVTSRARRMVAKLPDYRRGAGVCVTEPNVERARKRGGCARAHFDANRWSPPTPRLKSPQLAIS